ncbi:MAG: hypothetical protein JJ992_27790 [Planctomycetes bacterium]|nr:hypothetical protein [Planctomycetota bacterium]
MARTVDPYYEWLGIPPKDQPPNHYRLLGLELYEPNRNVIDTAANRQMSFIKTYQTGPPEIEELSQRILNELAAARLCLLNPEKKNGYDDQLRARLQGEPSDDTVVPESLSSVLDRPKSAGGALGPTDQTMSPRVPIESPASETPLLPPMIHGKTLSAPPPIRPRADHSKRLREHTSKPAASLAQLDLPENYIIGMAVGAGAVCLLLALALIVWFAGRSKPEAAPDRQATTLASTAVRPANEQTATTAEASDSASAMPVESTEPAPVHLNQQAGFDIASESTGPSGDALQIEDDTASPDALLSAPDAVADAESLRLATASPATSDPATIRQSRLGSTMTRAGSIRPEPEVETAAAVAVKEEVSETRSVASTSATADPKAALPSEIEILIGEAQQLIDRRDYEDAKKRLLQVNLIERDQRQMCFYLGLLAALVEHDVADARKYFSRARGSDTQHVSCLNNLGILAVRARDTSQAVRYWKEALGIDAAPEIQHNVQVLLSLADRDRVNLSSGVRDNIEDVLQTLSLSGKIDESDSPGRRSSSRNRGFSRGWQYMDFPVESLGTTSWHWPDLSDRSCMQCNGLETADCPATG